MPKPLSASFVLILEFIFCIGGYAQQTGVEKSNLRMNDSLVALYRNSIAQGNRFYNGTEYIGYVMRPKGHPFFESDRMQFAEISHEGVLYTDSIQYDLIDDAIIVKSYEGDHNFRMVNEKIRSFKIRDRVFVRLGASTDSTDEMSPGFYEQLYNGKAAVFVRHKKQLNTTTFQSEVFSEYVQYDAYFVRKGNEYYRVNSNKSLLDAFSEKKGELRRFFREQRLDFKKDPSNTARKAAEFFDQLNK